MLGESNRQRIFGDPHFRDFWDFGRFLAVSWRFSKKFFRNVAPASEKSRARNFFRAEKSERGIFPGKKWAQNRSTRNPAGFRHFCNFQKKIAGFFKFQLKFYRKKKIRVSSYLGFLPPSYKF